MVPISSRKIVPPSASAKRPFLVKLAPVNAPRTWPNSSDSSSVSGIAAQLTLMSGMSRWRAARVNRTRDELLAGAGLAGEEHRAARFGDELCPADHVEHGAAAADEAVVVELGVALAEQIAQAGARALILEQPAHGDEQLVDVERLLQIVACAQLHRLDRALDGAVRGHHHDRRPLAVRRRGRELANHLEAGALGHQVVDDEQVEGSLDEQALRFERARRRDDLMALLAQRASQRLEDLLFVVREEDAARLGAHARASGPSPSSMRMLRAGAGGAGDARSIRRARR